jgi:uncharacterized protein YjeT (DUF2065 family)
MSYIDVAIPLFAGILLIISPRLFTKAQGEVFVRTKNKLRTLGIALICVAALYLAVKIFGK